MRIFLSHRSRDKALVREFRSLLPRFLDTWLDEESLSWGDSFPAELRSSIQSGVDFLIIFLDNDALSSEWVKQELRWAIEREKELKRTFVLPILLEEVASEKLPPGFSERLYLRLSDFTRASVESLANRATLQLFQLVVESFSGLQLEIPRRESLRTVRDQLSAGQARLLGHVVQQCKGASEVTQREIESTMGYSHSSAELFYRLESLIAQGFLLKRRISADGQFSYRLSDDFEKELREA
jgi:TIR domain